MKYCLIIFFVLPSFLSFSQIRIIDSEDLSPIPFAIVVNENGIYVGSSNQQGILEIDENAPRPLHRLVVQRLSYNNLSFDWDSIAQIQIIKLIKRDFVIPEVIVAGHTKEKPQYVMLRGFFRSYQLQDGIPKYYADGIVEYYLRKNTVKNRIVQVRFFRNEALVKILAKRAGGIIGFDVGKLTFPTLSLINSRKSDYSFETYGDKSNILKKGIVVGVIQYNDSSKISEVFFDKIAPDSIKVFSIFGVTYKTIRENNIENYYSTSINQISNDSLISQYTFAKNIFIDKDKNPIEFVKSTEFYVFESKPVYKSDLKEIKLSSNFELKNESRIENEYWTQLDEYQISSLPSFIEDLLGSTLIQY